MKQDEPIEMADAQTETAPESLTPHASAAQAPAPEQPAAHAETSAQPSEAEKPDPARESVAAPVWRVLQPEVQRLPVPMQQLLDRLPIEERVTFLLQHFDELRLFRSLPSAAVPPSPTAESDSIQAGARVDATANLTNPTIGRRLYENF